MLLATLFSYNLAVTGGLVNFAIGIGIALHALALWLEIDTKHVIARLLIFNSFGVVLFFCHVASYALFVFTVGLIEATPKADDTVLTWLRRCLTTPLFFGFAAFLWLLTERIDDRVIYAPPFKLLRYMAAFWSGNARSDLIAVAGFLVVASLGLFRRKMRISRTMALPLAGLAGALLLLPSSWAAGALIDARLNVFIALVGAASLSWRAVAVDFACDFGCRREYLRPPCRPVGSAMASI